jgi:hypothetical protein
VGGLNGYGEMGRRNAKCTHFAAQIGDEHNTEVWDKGGREI